LGHWVSAGRKKEGRADHEEEQDNKKQDSAGHFDSVLVKVAGLLPDHASLCIARIVEKRLDKLDRPIVLVGLMGAGKSTVGRRLAKRLDLPFVDSDDAIEDAAGYSAAEIFERYGEKDFRDGERRLVARLIDGSVGVIATGGGAFVDPRTRELLNQRAITVWLDAPVAVLAERTSRRDTRPLLRNGDPKATLERLADERRRSYSEAHIRITSGGGGHDNVVERIIAAVEQHLRL
jgi:shikimate kinase